MKILRTLFLCVGASQICRHDSVGVKWHDEPNLNDVMKLFVNHHWAEKLKVSSSCHHKVHWMSQSTQSVSIFWCKIIILASNCILPEKNPLHLGLNNTNSNSTKSYFSCNHFLMYLRNWKNWLRSEPQFNLCLVECLKTKPLNP